MINVGDYVSLTPGTIAFVKYEGESRYERAIVNEDWEGVVIRCTSVGCSHATMNGGGHDYSFDDPWSGTKTRVRTTFQRPAEQTFVRKSRRDAGLVV